ncbi:hypothetical protein E2C01_097011 [Portunus trituberculatus]|uniref:Uncharacterized protein n=1 Tax=Portunus trituberculatus TaxID=210409 RepID=A0A5B7K8U1_PORTR|nr:hypothetical protein [Portunus trituberculatus]
MNADARQEEPVVIRQYLTLFLYTCVKANKCFANNEINERKGDLMLYFESVSRLNCRGHDTRGRPDSQPARAAREEEDGRKV